MRWASLALALAVFGLGCASTRTRVITEDGESFQKYHRIGVPSFKDRQGKGKEIADGLSAALQAKVYSEAVDRTVLEQILSKYKLDTDQGLGVEALEEIRDKTQADSIIFGSMAPNWSVARITVVETEMGGPVVRALVFPKRGKKVFATPQEVVDETVRALARAQ